LISNIQGSYNGEITIRAV
jgi:hypothetical protein